MPISDPQTLVVEFAGELSIKTAAATHAELTAALEAHEAVSVRVGADAAVDLTFIQLVEAARRTAAEAGRVFALAQPAQGALLETLRRGGFTQGAGQQAFWLHETEDC